MLKPLCWALALAVVTAATPAAAQNGAMWQDDRGRSATLQFSGATAAPPVATDRPVAEMVDLFTRACLPEGASQLAALVSEGTLAPRPFTVPGTKKAAPVPLDIYQGSGFVIARTDGFFVAPQAQCNAVFYVATLPDAQALTAALQSVLGVPSNAAEAVDKKGKPRRSYSPEWSTVIDGRPSVISASVMKASNYMPGDRVHLAVRATG